MALQAVTLSNWQSLTTYALPGGSYNQNHLGMGSLMCRKNDGGNTGKWIGPCPIAVARPFEQSTSIAPTCLHVIEWSATKHWVFYGDAATAAATRRVGLYEYDLMTQAFSWRGFITLTYPPNTNHTLRGLRMTYDLHNTGTVAVSGTAVTGSGTTWTDDKVCVGNRIGFGSTDPTAITTWYEISAVGSNTSITLTGSAPTFSAGTAYVIEDLRAVTVTTNATATNGGLFVAKGLRFENFSNGGTTISAATTVDNIRAVYWLADAATVTNTVATGMAIEPITNKSNHNIWVFDGTTTVKMFEYNLRATLSGLASGKSTSAYLLASAGQAVTGTGSATNNGRYAVASHGPGSGVACAYYVTTTRVHRSVALSTITNGGNWQADNMTEVPPGGIASTAAGGALSNIEYSGLIDRFLLLTAGTGGIRSYVTQYRTDAGQFDRFILVESKGIDGSGSDPDQPAVPSVNALPYQGWVENGVGYLLRVTGAAGGNLYAIPIGADWEYAATTNQRIILPKIDTPNADRLRRVHVSHADILGEATGQNLGFPVEPHRVLYRTAGISDNTGGWTILDDTGDLSGVSPGASIQFALEFRTIGTHCIPGRIYAVTLLYDDTSTDSHYQPSVGQSSTTNKRFAWRHAVAFGGSVPALRIRLYNAVSGGLLLDDNTSSPAGTWERSTDGGNNYVAWTNADKSNDTTYIRYTPASLADNIRVRAILTQL